ncbi:MAG: alpha/beta hydrolase [Chakrabartia sp.]
MSLRDIGKSSHPLQNGMQQVLDIYDQLDPQPLETLAISTAREQPGLADAMQVLMRRRRLDPRDDLGVPVRRVTMDLPSGPVEARLYGTVRKGVPAPLMLYWHGGGFVLRTVEDEEFVPRSIAAATDGLVLACGYRRGPEARFPAAQDDAWAAYLWVSDNAAVQGWDRNRLALIGEGAGGNLALNVALQVRDAGEIAPLSLVLIYPWVSSDFGGASHRDHAHAVPFNRAMLHWMLDHYLRSPGDLNDPRMNLLAAELWGLPPVLIVAADIDPLASDGLALAERLSAAGVPVVHKSYAGVTHGFFGLAPVVREAAQAQAAVAAELRKRLALGLRGRLAQAFA